MEITVVKENADHNDVMRAFYNKIYTQVNMSTNAEETYQLAEAYRALNGR